MRHRADCRLGVMDSDGLAEGRSQRRDPLKLGKAGYLDDVWLDDVHAPLEDQVPVLPVGEDHLPGCDGNVQGIGDVTQEIMESMMDAQTEALITDMHERVLQAVNVLLAPYGVALQHLTFGPLNGIVRRQNLPPPRVATENCALTLCPPFLFEGS